MRPEDLKAEMEAAAMDTVSLSRMLGIERRTVYRWLDGTHSIPPMVESIVRLSRQGKISARAFINARQGHDR